MTAKSTFIRVILISLFILTNVLSGTLVYSNVEDMSLFDALYLTVITLTTTGYGDVVPKTEQGRKFTMVLLMMGVGALTYSVSTILSYISSIDFTQRRRLKMEKNIQSFKGHTIVCGFGRMGEIICKRLHEEGVNFVVIEKREHLLDLIEKSGYNFIVGDAAHDEVLLNSGIKDAKVLVSVIDNDSDGLYVALAGRSFNKDLHIIVRAAEKSAERRMIRAGADKVVLPFVMSGMNVAESVLNPAVEDFLNIKGMKGSHGEEVPIQLADLYVAPNSDIIHQDLESVGPKMDKMIVVGIRKPSKEFIFNPDGGYVFEEGDCIIAMGDQDSYCKVRDKYHLTSLKKEELRPRTRLEKVTNA